MRDDARTDICDAPETVKDAMTPSHEKDTLAGTESVRPDHVAADASRTAARASAAVKSSAHSISNDPKQSERGQSKNLKFSTY